MTTIDHSITDHQGLVGETNLASGSGSDAAIASQLSAKANLISTPTNLDIVQTNGSGQPIDSGKVFSTDVTLGGGSASDNNISTQLAVKTYADTKANLISTPTNLDIVQTNGSGQSIDSGKVFSTDVTLGGGSASDNNIPTQLAVKTYADTKANLISTPTNLDIVQTNGSGQPIDSGKVFSTDVTLGGGSASDNNIPTQLAVKTYADTKANLISTPTNLDIVQTNGSGQPIDSGKVFSTDVTLGGGSASDNNISTQLAVKTYVDSRSTGLSLPIGTLNNVTVGLIQKWTTDSSINSLAPLASAQVTISWDSPFPTTIFLYLPSIREATANLPLSIKVLAVTLSDVSVEVTNLDATDATGNIVIKVLAFGN